MTRAALLLLLLLLLLTLTALAAAPAAAEPNGRSLYLQGCVTCHGLDGGGVPPKGGKGGPPLRGVGAEAAHLYLTTGYMPLDRTGDQPVRKDSPYTGEELQALIDYIGSFGGPPVPKPQPERGNTAEGMRLFAENCAGCHQIAGEGGLVVGAIAPEVARATPTQIAEAVRIGPYVMPRFGEQQLSDGQLDSLIRYVELTKAPDDRGGWGLGHLGPIPEGLVAWLLAGGALVGIALLIGGRAR
jgi:ubiquinol-cytochrome c reductase cytochrome c subunit